MLTALALASSACRDQPTGSGTKDIEQYSIESLRVSPDTISVGDTAIVTAGLYLDCTNRITRVDTSFDTLYTPLKVEVAIFGTVFTGPGPRPLCPAVLAGKNIALVFPKPGIWIVEASEPPSPAVPPRVRDTIIVR